MNPLVLKKVTKYVISQSSLATDICQKSHCKSIFDINAVLFAKCKSYQSLPRIRVHNGNGIQLSVVDT